MLIPLQVAQLIMGKTLEEYIARYKPWPEVYTYCGVSLIASTQFATHHYPIRRGKHQALLKSQGTAAARKKLRQEIVKDVLLWRAPTAITVSKRVFSHHYIFTQGSVLCVWDAAHPTEDGLFHRFFYFCRGPVPLTAINLISIYKYKFTKEGREQEVNPDPNIQYVKVWLTPQRTIYPYPETPCDCPPL